MRPVLIGLLTSTLMVLNVAIAIVPLMFFAFCKVLIPAPTSRRFCSAVIVWIAETWAEMCKKIFALTTSVTWNIQGVDQLNTAHSYMIISNHQTWVDIPVLIQAFNKKIPFFKFFLKKELIWIPFFGLAWWALDYPFMKRYSKSFLKKHPELKGADVKVTKAACEKFKSIPVSLMNFVEGTRFTIDKCERQSSPYKHLLRPKSGGVAFALQILGQRIKRVLDVTIIYPKDETPGFWALLSGQVSSVIVDVKQLEFNDEMLAGDYENDAEFRKIFHRWLGDLWQQKDNSIAHLREKHSTS